MKERRCKNCAYGKPEIWPYLECNRNPKKPKKIVHKEGSCLCFKEREVNEK